MASRILKVCAVFPYAVHGQFVEVPAIKLQGKWLGELGFTTNRTVEVLENRGAGEITLRLTPKQAK